MERRELGRTGIEVSRYCLGTMTFGTHTPEAEAHRQIDTCLDHGVDFLDCAEMYPVAPVRAETMGMSEEVLGTWIARTGRRGDIVLATKHSGEGSFARDGAPISGETIPGTVAASLKRLKTDVIDLYQFHWPNRGSYMFRKNWTYDPTGTPTAEVKQDFDDCMGALAREVEKGTIRAFGLSNESCWGTMQWLAAAERTGGPRVATVQNEYSLLCRLYDTDMAEMTAQEDVGLLPFSPLGAGYLTGKYAGGAVPEGSRKSNVPDMGGRESDRVHEAVAAYHAVAERHGLDPVHMAMAFTLSRPFVTSSIFGATTMEQLTRILGGIEVTLSDEVLSDIDTAHRAHPMPY